MSDSIDSESIISSISSDTDTPAEVEWINSGGAEDGPHWENVDDTDEEVELINIHLERAAVTESRKELRLQKAEEHRAKAERYARAAERDSKRIQEIKPYALLRLSTVEKRAKHKGTTYHLREFTEKRLGLYTSGGQSVKDIDGQVLFLHQDVRIVSESGTLREEGTIVGHDQSVGKLLVLVQREEGERSTLAVPPSQLRSVPVEKLRGYWTSDEE